MPKRSGRGLDIHRLQTLNKLIKSRPIVVMKTKFPTGKVGKEMATEDAASYGHFTNKGRNCNQK